MKITARDAIDGDRDVTDEGQQHEGPLETGVVVTCPDWHIALC